MSLRWLYIACNCVFLLLVIVVTGFFLGIALLTMSFLSFIVLAFCCLACWRVVKMVLRECRRKE